MIEVFVLSDGTGETADKLVQAALVQYPENDPLVSRFKSLKNEEQIRSIIDEAKETGAILVYTVARPDLRSFIKSQSEKMGIRAIDLLGPLLDSLGEIWGEKPQAKSGLLHEVNEEYFKRIEAIEFTVKHDDGSNPDNLKMADINSLDTFEILLVNFM